MENHVEKIMAALKVLVDGKVLQVICDGLDGLRRERDEARATAKQLDQQVTDARAEVVRIGLEGYNKNIAEIKRLQESNRRFRTGHDQLSMIIEGQQKAEAGRTAHLHARIEAQLKMIAADGINYTQAFNDGVEAVCAKLDRFYTVSWDKGRVQGELANRLRRQVKRAA